MAALPCAAFHQAIIQGDDFASRLARLRAPPGCSQNRRHRGPEFTATARERM